MSGDAAALESGPGLAERLVAAGLLIPTGVRGLYGRAGALVELLEAVERRIDGECAPDGAERVRFPPLVPREMIRRTGYMEGFPQLLGSVHSFDGGERDHLSLLERVEAGESWGPHMAETELTLTPACCYPLYPTLSGELSAEGRLFDLTSHCFRREPSDDPTRMQSFVMRENVRVGPADAVEAWWSGWMDRGEALLHSLGLDAARVPANDPFFGRGGRMMKASQREQELKFELVVPVCGDGPTAVASFNRHQTHFTGAFEVTLPGGETAHSACMGFGIERMALALLVRHGLSPQRWPADVRERLWP